MMHTSLDTTNRPGFSGPPLSPTNQPDAMALPDDLRRIVDNLPFGCTVDGLMSYLNTRVTRVHDLYLVLRHLDDPNLESGLLAQSKPLRVYLEISKGRRFAHSSNQPIIEPERACEALAWAATRMPEKYQQRALTLLEEKLPHATTAVRSQVLEALNRNFDQLSEASRLQLIDKLMAPAMLHELPDRVLLPLQQRLNALRRRVAPARSQQIEQVSNAITRTMYQNLAANLPCTLPEPITFHTDRTGPHLLRNIATCIGYANSPAQQIAALDILTPARLAALPQADREKVCSTLHALQSVQPGSRRTGAAMPVEVADRIDQLLQLIAEHYTFLTSLRMWLQQPTIPPSAESKPIAAARIAECCKSGAPNLTLSSLGLSTLPAVLPPHIKGLNVNDNALTSLPTLPAGLTHLIASNNQLGSLPTLPDDLEVLFVFNNQLEQLPTLPAGLTELRASKNPLLTNLNVAQVSLLNAGCKVNLSGTNIDPAEFSQLHSQIAHLGGPEVTPIAELPLPASSFIEASHWVLEHLSDMPAALQQRALERILIAPFDDIATRDLRRLRRMLPRGSHLPEELEAAKTHIENRISNVKARRAEENIWTREEYFEHWDAWAQEGGSSGGDRTSAVAAMKKCLENSGTWLIFQSLFLTSLPDKLPRNIAYVNAEANKLDDEAAVTLADINSNINLFLSFNLIGDAGAQALAISNKIIELGVRSNRIGDAGARALAANKTIINLDLRDNLVGDAGAQALARNNTITYLDVSGNTLGDAAAEALAANTTITNLDVCDNRIGNVGADALLKNCRLKYLDLSGNQVDAIWGQTFVDNKTLTTLIMSNSALGDVEAMAIAKNTSIKCLDLSRNRIGNKGAQALALNKTLTELFVQSNDISDVGARALVANHKFNRLFLEGNPISDAEKNRLRRKIFRGESGWYVGV